jgi:hypothetical protein
MVGKLDSIESRILFTLKLTKQGKKVAFGTLPDMALLRSDVSEEHNISIIRVARIGDLGTKLVVNSN